MVTECPHCGASCVGWEGYDTQEDSCTQHVCRSCGVILEEGSFQNDNTAGQEVPVHINYTPSGTESMSLPQGYLDNLHSVAPTVRVSEGHKLGKRKIKQLFRFIGVEGKHLIQEAIDMYNDVLKKSFFKNQQLQQKEYIAGACVLVVCRRQDMPVTVTMVSMMLNCDEMAFNSEFFKLQKALNIKLKPLDIDALVEKLCNGQSTECIKRTKQVLTIARETWITEGRYRDGLVMAANFFAWKSLNFYSGCKVELKTYVAQQNWKFSRRIFLRHRDIGTVLCTLAVAIPWLSQNDLNIKNIAVHLEDIIQYQKSLFRETRAMIDADDATVTSGEKNNHVVVTSGEKNNHSPGDTIKIAPDEAIQQTDLISNVITPEQIQAHGNNTRTSTSLKRKYLSFPGDAVDAISEPPSTTMKKSRKSDVVEIPLIMPYHPNLDSENIGEEDIPDSDMNYYIKQEHEIACHNLLRQKPGKSKNYS